MRLEPRSAPAPVLSILYPALAILAAMVFASAVGPGLTGYLIDAGVDYSHQLAAMGAYSLAAAAMMGLVSRRLKRRSAACERVQTCPSIGCS